MPIMFATSLAGRAVEAISGYRQAVILPLRICICLGLLVGRQSATVGAQSQCPSMMCERPLSTVRAQTLAETSRTCYLESEQVDFYCNVGFRVKGDNYTATCISGVWRTEYGCVIDLFAIIVVTSASLVAIFVFSIVMMCICANRRGRSHRVTKPKGKRKRRAPKGGEASTNGHARTTQPPAATAEDDDFEDDFTDDDDEDVIIPKPGAHSDSATEHIYMNH